MSIRRKVLLLLCTIALVPAAVTAWLDVRILRSLGESLSARTEAALEDQAIATMNRVATDAATALDREARRVATIVGLQAERAERLLATPPAPGARPRFEDAFDAKDASLGLAQGRTAGGQTLAVSLTHQVFRAAPGTERAAVANSAAALVPMTRLYRHLHEPGEPVIRWHYVVLENGLSAAWPGHGGYPADFDPRARPWYTAQRDAPGFRWHPPHVDASTGALVINATQPLFDAQGRFTGVTGVDVDVLATFDVVALPAHLREGSEVTQVAVLPPGDAQGPRVVVLARSTAASGGRSWQVAPALEPWTLEDAAATEAVTAALRAGRDGFLRVHDDGTERFLLYRGFGEAGGYLILSVPVASAVGAAREAAAHARAAVAGHARAVVTVFAVAFAVTVLVALLAARQLTRPVRALNEAVQRLARGDYGVRVDVASRDELGALAGAFNAMVPRLADHARVRDALGLAREVQQQLLPSAPPSVPGWDISALSRYSDQTGGDYFDYLPLDGAARRHAIVVADVSGHGVGPALLMATTRALLHGAQDRGGSLGELLSHVNVQLADDVHRGHFVTLFALGIEADGDRVCWAGAGHDAALLLEAASGRYTELTVSDIPLAIDDGWTYTDAGERRVAPGDIVVVGTDGIWETANPEGERFGRERLRAFVAGHAAESAESIGLGLLAELTRFRGGARQADDITVAVVKRVAGA